MTRKNKIGFTAVTIIIGFMLAIQFETINEEPIIRDTRDTWELRSDLLNEQQLQSNLIKEARNLDEKLASYETERTQSKEQILRETLLELKKEVGLTSVEGKGIIMTIEPIAEELSFNTNDTNISPDMLRRLINELNMYGALNISLNGQRIINTSVIRDINGVTKVDGYPLNRFPIEIKVLSDQPGKLYDRIKVAQVVEDFFIDNLTITISSPQENVKIPAYQDSIRIKNMETVTELKGGDS
ncbi:DUF881 domain-containing protein [Peribacillus alkalitolerans]|uniref:DUF881 domain-containing protein n=1 Tax=Peribacillus alkalitolerans TaxID=1550385 RepID=UPI001F087D63|nr:DUF881 domain-containing protein [Peribacillus alkalitolerans]